MGVRARVAGGNQGAVGPVSQSEEFSNMTERGEPNTAAEIRGRAQRCMDFCEGPLYFLPEQFQGGGRSQSAGCEDGNGARGCRLCYYREKTQAGRMQEVPKGKNTFGKNILEVTGKNRER